MVGVYTNQRLSLSTTREGLRLICRGFEPDSRDVTVRDYRGASYRSSTRTTARKIYYYRCPGSDAWRHLGGPVCDSKPIRQDLLDEVVWREILKLLESPYLIQEELERRLAAARTASPVKRREENLQRHAYERAWNV